MNWAVRGCAEEKDRDRIGARALPPLAAGGCGGCPNLQKIVPYIDAIRAAVLAKSVQFFKELSAALYGANRPHTKVSQGLRDSFLAPDFGADSQEHIRPSISFAAL